MSTRLDLALHEIAEAVGGASAFGDATAPHTVATVRRLTGRVRRRRAVRGVGTAAVAASAAGAVVIVGPLAERPVPATSGAACGSVLDLPTTTGPAGFTIRADTTGARLDDGGSFGTRQGEQLAVQVEIDVDDATPMTDGAPAPEQVAPLPTAPELLITDDDVVVTESVLAPATVAGSDGGGPGTWSATDGPATTAGGATWHATAGNGHVSVGWSDLVDLVSCTTGEALTPGAYEVWASRIGDDGRTRTVGPFDLTLVAEQPAVTSSLPADFPSEVPLVGGRLGAVARAGGAWTVEVETPGDDRAEVARALLDRAATRQVDGFGGSTSEVTTTPDGGLVVGRWAVTVAASTTADGSPSVVYRLTPQD
jgi:hypothetical protein